MHYCLCCQDRSLPPGTEHIYLNSEAVRKGMIMLKTRMMTTEMVIYQYINILVMKQKLTKNGLHSMQPIATAEHDDEEEEEKMDKDCFDIKICLMEIEIALTSKYI